MSRSWKKQGGQLRRMNLVKTNQLVASEDHHFHTFIVPTGGADHSVTTGDTITFKEGKNVYITGDNVNKIITFNNIAARVPDISGVWNTGSESSNFAIEASNNTGTAATGHYAVAAGAACLASGEASFADGSACRAIGNYSVALGYDCSAVGMASFVDGSGCTAYHDYSIALGYKGNTKKSQATDVSMGELIFVVGADPVGNVMEVDICGNLWLKRTGLVNQSSMWKKGKTTDGLEPSGALIADNHNTSGLTARAKYAIATGEGGGAHGVASFVGGYKSHCSAHAPYSLAMGFHSSCHGEASFSMGNNSQSDGDYSYTFGKECYAKKYASLAGGQGSHAHGEKSVALGWGAQAWGLTSFSLGEGTRSVGDYSAAFGRGTTAQGYLSCAMGCHTEASGNISFAIGKGTHAWGEVSTAIGYHNRALGDYSWASGKDCSAIGQSSFVHGFKCEASGITSTAFGNQTRAYGDYSATFGKNTTADGVGSFAMGLDASCAGRYSVVFGHKTHTGEDASGAVSMGYGCVCNAPYSLAMGSNCTATESAHGSFVCGDGNTTKGQYSIAFGQDSSGIGDYSFVLGYNCRAEAQFSVVIGRNNIVGTTGEGSICMGEDSSGSGKYVFIHGKSCGIADEANYSVALGQNNFIDHGAENNIIIGLNGYIGKETVNSVIFGTGCSIGSGLESCLATGKNTKATGNYSCSFGKNTLSTGTASISMGQGTSATGDYSVAIGLDSSATRTGAIAMGESCLADNENSIVLGKAATTATTSSWREKYNALSGKIIFAIGADPTDKAGGEVAIGNILELDSEGRLWTRSTGIIQKPTASSTELPIGAIIPLAGIGAIPSGWIKCDGAAISIQDNQDLFSVIAFTYGTGDPDGTTFNVPDLRGRTPWGECKADSIVVPGSTAGGLVNYPETLDISGGVPQYYTAGTGPAKDLFPTGDPYIWPRIPCPYAGTLKHGESAGTTNPPLLPDHKHHISQEPHTHDYIPSDPQEPGTYTTITYTQVNHTTTDLAINITKPASAHIGTKVLDENDDPVLDTSGVELYDGMTDYVGVPAYLQTTIESGPLIQTDFLPPCIAFTYIIKAL